jgi:3-dehydroquinate synthase
MDYSIKIKDSSEVIVGSVSELLPRLLPDKRVVVVSDTNIDRHYHTLVNRYEHVLIGLGEASKTLVTADAIYKKFISMGVDRSTFVLAIGGGIVTDVAGFVASTYMRGVEFGFVSTSLLGQVDASVGGKNGVNVAGYKNMAGCFAQPDFVVCDPAMLCTLPDREFRAGLAEMVKAALIADGDLFAALERSSFAALREAPEQLRDLITAAIRVKADIVGRDERERGERRKLNLGHTLAHAIEKCSDRMNHGEAVAVGIALMAGAARRLGLLDAAQCDRIVRLLERLGFDLQPPVPLERLLREAGHDKKNEQGTLHVVLPAGIGDCVVRDIPTAEFATLFADAR